MIKRLTNAIRRHGLTGVPAAALRLLKRRCLWWAPVGKFFTHAEQAAAEGGLPPRILCPLCGHKGHCFAPFETGGVARMSAICPHCGSLERHRLSKLVLDDLAVAEWRGRILHFAPEPHVAAVFRSVGQLEYFTADLDPAEVDCGVDIQCLPFADNSFDYVYCSHVLEHVPDDSRALTELRRILRPGGIALVCVPHDPDAAETVMLQSDSARHGHLRHYGKDLLERAAVHFDVRDYSTDSWPAADALRHGLCRSDMLLVGR